jgi:hypothetical protein
MSLAYKQISPTLVMISSAPTGMLAAAKPAVTPIQHALVAAEQHTSGCRFWGSGLPPYCYPIGELCILAPVNKKPDVWQGTLALMILKTLERTNSMHGYGIARRIEQTSSMLLSVNYGTLYPALLKLEQEG